MKLPEAIGSSELIQFLTNVYCDDDISPLEAAFIEKLRTNRPTAATGEDMSAPVGSKTVSAAHEPGSESDMKPEPEPQQEQITDTVLANEDRAETSQEPGTRDSSTFERPGQGVQIESAKVTSCLVNGHAEEASECTAAITDSLEVAGVRDGDDSLIEDDISDETVDGAEAHEQSDESTGISMVRSNTFDLLTGLGAELSVAATDEREDPEHREDGNGKARGITGEDSDGQQKDDLQKPLPSSCLKRNGQSQKADVRVTSTSSSTSVPSSSSVATVVSSSASSAPIVIQTNVSLSSCSSLPSSSSMFTGS